MSGHEDCGILQRRGLGMGGCSSGVHVATLLVSFASPLLTRHLAVLLDGKLWKEPFMLLGIVVLTWVGQLLAGKTRTNEDSGSEIVRQPVGKKDKSWQLALGLLSTMVRAKAQRTPSVTVRQSVRARRVRMAARIGLALHDGMSQYRSLHNQFQCGNQ